MSIMVFTEGCKREDFLSVLRNEELKNKWVRALKR